MKYKILKYFIAFVLFICVSFFLSLKWFFWEPYGVKKNSLVYMLKVPDVAKNFPIWGADGSPEYDVNIADGLKPSTIIIRYNSMLAFDVLKQRVLDEGYSCKTYGKDKTEFCEKDGEYIDYQLRLEKIEKKYYIKIIIIEYLQ